MLLNINVMILHWLPLQQKLINVATPGLAHLEVNPTSNTYLLYDPGKVTENTARKTAMTYGYKADSNITIY